MNRVETQQLVRDMQVGVLSRREFLIKATAAIGSLAAANALLAACSVPTNVTPPPVVDANQPVDEPGFDAVGGLISGVITYRGPDGVDLMGYIARPDAAEPRTAVIVIQEWWGLNEHIKDVARRLAEEGFVAFAPDLYHGVVTTEPDEARKLAMALGMGDAVGEILAAADYLQGQTFVTGKVGVMGFCMGGGLVLQTAANAKAGTVGAAIPFYGTPLNATDARKVVVPVLSFLGTRDGISASGYENMHAIFDEAGIANEFVLYEGAQHAFFNDTRISYDPKSAADAWERTLAWFRSYLET